VRQLQAYALERCGRCFYRAENYYEAYRIYEGLLDDYGELKNRVGLPYGLIVPLCLHDIARYQTIEMGLLEILIDTLRNLRNGEWSLNNSTYDYYSKEINDILRRELSREKYPPLLDSYNSLLESSTPYLEELAFRKLLIENVIPIMKDRAAFSQFAEEPLKGRFPVVCDGGQFLVSYSWFRDVSSNQFFYAGFCWNLDYIKDQKLPEIANNLVQTSGIQVRFIDDEYPDEASHQESVIPKNTLVVNFRQFPFPWRFVVTLTSLENLKSTARRENLFHGILLIFIVGLMCMGAFLISRDVSRESEAARHKSEFVHNISHELKTPLTLIRLYGETLKDGRILSEEIRHEAYEIITKESERLSHMINNVLDFSRIETGRKEFYFKKGDLAKIVKETLDSYRYHLEKKGFSIQEEIETNLPPMDFDREAITSVLINLLSNAMKFSPEKNEVAIRLFKDDNSVILQVEDKGIGISQKEADKIFQRFYRSGNSIVSESRGSGLGLTIIQHIAEAHGGRVELESELGKGSVFSVVFPITRISEDKK
jgi:signal transduction histidine kinase